MGYWNRKLELTAAAKRPAELDLDHDSNTTKKLKVDDTPLDPAIIGLPPLKAIGISLTAANKGSSILTVSSELRKLLITGKIGFPDPIIITADGPPEELEPNALAISTEKLYQEGIPYFYCDNSFSLQVQDYNIRAFLPWLDRAKQYRDHAVCNGTVTIALHGDPHWENLVDWLELAHSGKYLALEDNCENHGSAVEAVKGAFAQIVDYAAKGYNWKNEAEVGLRGMRRMLAALDQRWDDDHTGMIEKAEPGNDGQEVLQTFKDTASERSSTCGIGVAKTDHEDQEQDGDVFDQSSTPRGGRSPSPELCSTFATTQNTYETALEQQFVEESQEYDFPC
ncbi:hypothetical protein LTR78_006090 [Recurvomyces mirabilis]|uniref:Uncharacterized protein n=1 Tax=Recurvomyces mirabilis TaxID=574656 RepID=A0AAE0WLF7_9PEZI|nr:hypothetical protein LTR78_006090 [Recurvomyces mirabilis]KAK5151933.1 hypothetical protein LTS14_008707 [Recurvomyces mirabilis]